MLWRFLILFLTELFGIPLIHVTIIKYPEIYLIFQQKLNTGMLKTKRMNERNGRKNKEVVI